MDGGDAAFDVSIRVDEDAYLEYSPEPLILFPRARLSTSVRVTAAPDATLFLCDSFLTHDPAAAGGTFGWLRGETRIERPDGTLICLDRFDISGTALGGGMPGIDGGYGAYATVIALGDGGAPANSAPRSIGFRKSMRAPLRCRETPASRCAFWPPMALPCVPA